MSILPALGMRSRENVIVDEGSHRVCQARRHVVGESTTTRRGNLAASRGSVQPQKEPWGSGSAARCSIGVEARKLEHELHGNPRRHAQMTDQVYPAISMEQITGGQLINR